MKRIHGFLAKKGESKNVITNISVPDVVSAPIDAGQKIGEITFVLNNEIIGSTNIVAKEEVKKLNIGNMISNVIDNWFKLFR